MQSTKVSQFHDADEGAQNDFLLTPGKNYKPIDRNLILSYFKTTS